MRKYTVVALVVLLLIGGGAYAYLNNTFRPEVRHLNDLSRQWMEDLQYKDFRSSGLYHHRLDRHRVDIGRTLERLFLVKPEILDIQDFHVLETEVDSTGTRARVRMRVRYQKLNKDKEPKENEVMLYWMKRHPDCPIGASCPEAEKPVCKDEFGNTLYKPKEDDENGSPVAAPEPGEASDEKYPCEPGADRQWFMNLDSTLKEKSYQRD